MGSSVLYRKEATESAFNCIREFTILMLNRKEIDTVKRRFGFSILMMIFLMAISFFCQFTTALATQESYGYTQSRSSDEMVLLMDAPNPNANVIGKFFDGVYFEELERVDNWSHVKLFSWGEEHSFGYVLTDELVAVEDGFVQRFPLGHVTTIEDTPATLYAKPQDTANPIGNCIDGTPVGVLGIVGEWYHIRVGTSCQGYLRIINVNIESEKSHYEHMMSDNAPLIASKYDYEANGVVDGFVRLYILPDESSDWIYNMVSGMPIQLLADLGEMCQVKFYTFDGFVKTEYLDLANIAEE